MGARRAPDPQPAQSLRGAPDPGREFLSPQSPDPRSARPHSPDRRVSEASAALHPFQHLRTSSTGSLRPALLSLSLLRRPAASPQRPVRQRPASRVLTRGPRTRRPDRGRGGQTAERSRQETTVPLCSLEDKEEKPVHYPEQEASLSVCGLVF